MEELTVLKTSSFGERMWEVLVGEGYMGRLHHVGHWKYGLSIA